MSTQLAEDALSLKYDISTDRFMNFLDEMEPLNVEHYREIAMYQDYIQLDPDYDQYLKLDEMGFLSSFTVRCGGELVGYSIFFVKNHIHYASDTYAINDLIFIKPEHRGSGVAKDLMDYSENFLRAMGCSVMTMHMKNYKPFRTLMRECEFDECETLYTKYIGSQD